MKASGMGINKHWDESYRTSATWVCEMH